MNEDIAIRFPENPLLSPYDLSPSHEGMTITSLFNPGVFRFEGQIGLVIRVAERPIQKDGFISFPVLSHQKESSIGGTIIHPKYVNMPITIVEIDIHDPDLMAIDSRVVRYKGRDFLTTLSHLRLLWSDDGITFHERKEYPSLYGKGLLETSGIEDCRVTFLDDQYYLSYTAVSENGVGVDLRTTKDWKEFKSHGMILPPHNKDCAVFEEKINGLFYALHRPSSIEMGGNYIWLAESPDGIYWGNHRCVLKTRSGSWDSARVGAGAAPIKTKQGWLEIYHGANEKQHYCLGAFLIDLKNPAKVLARTEKPIMVPREHYEEKGFFSHVVFTNGHLVNGDELIVYYGAADEYVCAARFSIENILSYLIYS